jgi:hypothetical protein
MGVLITLLVILVRGVLLLAFGISLVFCIFGAYISFGSLLWIFRDMLAGRPPTLSNDNLGWTMLFLLWIGGGLAGCWASARLFLRYGLNNLGRSATGRWTTASWWPFLLMAAAFAGGVVAIALNAPAFGVWWFLAMVAALVWFIWTDVAGLIKAMRRPVESSP